MDVVGQCLWWGVCACVCSWLLVLVLVALQVKLRHD